MKIFIALIIVLLTSTAVAGALDVERCFDDAAKKNGISRDILKSIAVVESALRPMAINKANQNKSEDVGLMQINSQHYEWLEVAGVKRKDLFNACVSIYVGALLLKDCIRRHGNTWAAVGAYNAGHANTPKAVRRRQIYATKVKRQYERLKRYPWKFFAAGA